MRYAPALKSERRETGLEEICYGRAMAQAKCAGSPHPRVREETAETRGFLMQELAKLL
jgi:hypothetical protein